MSPSFWSSATLFGLRKARQKREPTINENPKENLIYFNATDSLIVRAENIWKALGFCNDRANMVAQIAGFLATYRDLDDQQAKIHKIETSDQPKTLYAGPPPDNSAPTLSTRIDLFGDLRIKNGRLQKLYNDPSGGDRMIWLYVPEVGNFSPDVI